MKKHLLSLFDQSNRTWTISLLAIGVLLVIASQIVGTTDNIPGFLMLFFGVVFLFFGFLHPWKKSRSYGILAGICFGIIIGGWIGMYILVLLGKSAYINEGVVMITGFLLCLPGIVVGITGSIICAIRKK